MNIGTNLNTLYSLKYLSNINSYLNKYTEQFSSGSRINHASDDAAGLTVATNLDTQLRGTKIALQNSSDAISMLQVFDGASSSIESILQRMRELAVQSKNGTYTDKDRNTMNDEFSNLKKNVDNLILNTRYNGQVFFAAGILTTLQVGANANNQLKIESINLASIVSNQTISVDTSNQADIAIRNIDDFLKDVNVGRSMLGSYINRLTSISENLNTSALNLSDSKSRITDADMARTSSEFAKYKILQQSNIAMIAQENQSTQNVIQLLQ